MYVPLVMTLRELVEFKSYIYKHWRSLEFLEKVDAREKEYAKIFMDN